MGVKLGEVDGHLSIFTEWLEEEVGIQADCTTILCWTMRQSLTIRAKGQGPKNHHRAFSAGLHRIYQDYAFQKIKDNAIELRPEVLQISDFPSHVKTWYQD